MMFEIKHLHAQSKILVINWWAVAQLGRGLRGLKPPSNLEGLTQIFKVLNVFWT